ncbi:M23 family metallopeptidase [Sporolituus thermophilus]|uniref:Murein DD-endopeptidase MepM and murein hydrolase activator NlpD, contain LysM domain n=1 Tax=Sporolituus thermophilus DSM 23256 TaxID=1123285 RepID=A0A1G7HG44_9FIRM|nr:M23 family metallopeptidase [Sporolituus thermophilus]SDE99477.1 Murein DD-endopeptidase MepM and murein hydrolase activator NlpD, contain LysM domain [Sporolituus thermophilus DSM 23256]
MRANLDQLIGQTAGLVRKAAVAAGLLSVAGVLVLAVVVSLHAPPPAAPLSPPPAAADKQPAAALAPAAAATAPAGAEPAAPAAAKELASQLEPAQSAKSEPTPKSMPQVRPGSAHWPVAGQVTRAFGWYEDPLFKDWRYHTGIDVTARAGQAVTAMWDGMVAAVYTDRRTGLTVRVTTGDYTVDYGSLATAAVAPGDYIRAGMAVGTVGAATAEDYPHLHLSVKKGEKYCDPLTILPATAR